MTLGRGGGRILAVSSLEKVLWPEAGTTKAELLEYYVEVRPIEDVFTYVSDPLSFPRWNSAVEAVRKTSAGEDGVAATYSMERELPTGRAENELGVVACEWPREFAIRTTSGPTPFRYRYRFSAEDGETVVQLNAEVELHGAAAVLPQLARHAVKKRVDDNLATLRRILRARRSAISTRARGDP